MKATLQPQQDQRGLYGKFIVTRTDGKDVPGGKHEKDEYFVLNLTTDKHAIPAISAYAKSCSAQYPVLAAELLGIVEDKQAAQNEYVTVPTLDVPRIGIVESFMVGKYPAGRGYNDIPISTADAKPWVNINYGDSKAATERVGLGFLTAKQAMAIAFDICHQDENWTGGKVGEGHVFRGVHAGVVSGPVSGNYEPTGADERIWHVLSNGERIYHFVGNVFCWMDDNLHGDEFGLTKGIPADSPLLTLPPYPSTEKGMGWRPDGARPKWAGNALIHGGFWVSRDHAGVFDLDSCWPGGAYDNVGFRCTKPNGL